MFSYIKSKIKNFKKIFNFSLGKKLKELFSKKIDENLFLELEQLLYESDLGVNTSQEICEKVKIFLKKEKDPKAEDIIKFIEEEILKILKNRKKEPLVLTKPHIILIVGANGSGKTTSIAKLANLYKKEGKKVLIAAADTFRAAAVDQIEKWAKELNVDIVKSKQGSDPASVVFDALTAASARNSDLVIIDTAGRLHTKTDLMHELAKIKKVISKFDETAPHETLLTLDATIGQNAIEQAKKFNDFTKISSIILSKLDGTSKGGIIIAIKKRLDIDVKYIGNGEGFENILLFDETEFVKNLFKTKDD